jgi:putative membrane protein insertion efficiency factor
VAATSDHEARTGEHGLPTSALQRVALALLLGLIRLYQLLLSPWLGGQCRYLPTCSVYADEALRRFGIARGVVLIFGRLGRCHPWGGSGYDPVPEHEKREEPRSPSSGEEAQRR